MKKLTHLPRWTLLLTSLTAVTPAAAQTTAPAASAAPAQFIAPKIDWTR